MKRALAIFVACAGLVACGAPPTPQGQTEELSPEVMALVGPGQDLNTVRIESDGCYWWLHRGPVETTYIPLVTADSRMICTRAQ